MSAARMPSRLSRLWLVAATAAACIRPAAAQRPSPPVVRPLAQTRFELANGLVAILNDDHTTPLVAVEVWYHIGSKDDPPGHAGLAHLCEHVMSEGSPHLTQEFPTFYRSVGGTSPHWAETTEDVTEYYVVVPSNQLETVLWAESDRMASPLSLADAQHLRSIQAVVAQERRQNIENIPFNVSRELTKAALFPVDHPYHPGTPPSVDPDSRTPDEIRRACGPYYVPNNAVIALSGDFDVTTARRWIERYFGDIPRGQPVTHAATRVPVHRAEQRLVLEDPRAIQPQLHIDWIGAAYSNPDRQALRALASALSQPQFGRLSTLLVQDRQLASAVLADNYDFERSGVFEVAVFPRPGASMTLIEALVDSTLASLESAPVTPQELARFDAGNRVEAATSLQTKLARADTLAHDQVFTGDPASYAKQAAAASRLTPRDVERVARRYLTPGRVVMSLVPAGRIELASRPELPYVNVTPPRPAPTRP